MRDLSHLNEYRLKLFGSMGDAHNGAFALKLDGTSLTFIVIASDGAGWDHVSASTVERCPRWHEMQQIKELFFEDYEVVIQIHPAKSEHVNNYPHCLHLWRPQAGEIPLPDPILVGLKEAGTLA